VHFYIYYFILRDIRCSCCGAIAVFGDTCDGIENFTGHQPPILIERIKWIRNLTHVAS
jgi:hypothetical protein